MNKNKTLISAVAYARVSTRSDDQKNSFENQQKIFMERAEELGYYLVKQCGTNGIYADRGISGKSIKNRTEFNKMMKDSNKGFFSQILTTNIARYSRDIVTLQDTVRELRKKDIGVYFLKENINTGDYAKNYGDEVMLNILGALAQNELIALSKGIQVGMRQAQREGKWTSQPPFGYDRINVFLTVNEKESKIVKQIFDWYVNDGFSLWKIASLLNEQGIPSKKNKKWQQATIGKLIQNQIYTGKQINYQFVMLDIFTCKVIKVDEEDRIVHIFDQLKIIDEDTFNKANEIRELRASLVKSNNKYSSKNLLSNLFYCADCNASMKRVQRRDKPEKYYYLCSNRQRDKNMCIDYHYIREEDILIYLQRKVEELKTISLDKVREYYDVYVKTVLGKDFVNQLSDIEVSITRLEKRKNGLFTMRADGEIDKNDYNKIKKEIDEKLKKLEFSRSKINNINNEIKRIYEVYDSFVKNLNSFDIETAVNKKYRKIFRKITINNQKNIEIYWNNGLDKSFEEIISE
jgi:DNA invertase Pin-like site-specific DNA recombinase